MRNPISDTGLSTVYAPDEGDPLLDIVIVHGLQGHPFRTWASNKPPKTSSGPAQSPLETPKKRKRNHRRFLRRVVRRISTNSSNRATPAEPERIEPSADHDSHNPASVFWPGDLAPQDCPKSRILVFGYDTKVSKYMSGPTNRSHVMTHGKDLLYALSRERDRDRPLIFIAHSLGGIVVKEALSASAESIDDAGKNVIESTAAVIFLGTPHRGSPDLSALGEWARSVLSLFRMETTSVILDTLGLKTNDLERAQESFSRLWHKYDFRVKTFQEGLGLSGIHLGVLGNKVVPDYSSLLGDSREQAESIQSNHMDMCRFTGPDDPNYRKLAGELRSIHRSIQELNELNVHRNGLIQRGSLSPRLEPVARGDSERSENKSRDAAKSFHQNLKFPTMKQRYHKISTPADTTCSWIFEHVRYQDWFQGRNVDSHHGLLLLKGKPGAGKSVLMKEAYRRVSLGQADSNYATASFFFNAQGQKLEHSICGMFRSLLYQILPLHREALDHFASVWDDETTTLTEENLKEIFESIFSKPQLGATFIFIDALDECDFESVRSLAHFWRHVTLKAFSSGANLNVLMSIRHYPHIGLSNCYEMRVDHLNRHDIMSYIEQKISLVTIPQQSLVSLKTTLVEKSGGVFLWVVLMVERLLERLEDGEGLSAVMRDMSNPTPTLEALLTNILTQVDARSKELSIRLFQWAALTVKPLRLHEWHHVLAFIRRPTFSGLHEWRASDHFTENDEQLEKLIKSLSRGLLEVRATPILHDCDQEIMSTMAGAGSLDPSNGETRVVEFIHESVHEFFLHGDGFRYLDRSLLENPSAKGHLQIMETCLNYLNISELDALVEARNQLLPAKDQMPGPQIMNEPENIDSQTRIQVTERDRRPEEFCCMRPTPETHKRMQHSLPKSLDILSTAVCRIDVGRWVTSSQLQTRQGTSVESLCCSVAHLSVGASTKVLQDHPALLSYATYKLFSHAKQAQSVGANPESIIRRLQNGLWARWVLLSEAESPNMTLYEFAKEQKLTSWCLCLRPMNPDVEDQTAQRTSQRQSHSEDQASAVNCQNLESTKEWRKPAPTILTTTTSSRTCPTARSTTDSPVPTRTIICLERTAPTAPSSSAMNSILPSLLRS